MRKKNFEIRNSTGGKKQVKGFIAKITTSGNFKFGVAEVDGKWRVTELSTGLAIPGSFAFTAEESVKNAQASIDTKNEKSTYFEGIVTGVHQVLKLFDRQLL